MACRGRGGAGVAVAGRVVNLIVTGGDHLATMVKNRLKRVQYRPELIGAFFEHTGLNLEPQPP